MKVKSKSKLPQWNQIMNRRKMIGVASSFLWTKYSNPSALRDSAIFKFYMSSRSCSEGELLKNSAVKFALLDQKRGGVGWGYWSCRKMQHDPLFLVYQLKWWPGSSQTWVYFLKILKISSGHPKIHFTYLLISFHRRNSNGKITNQCLG